ncbi:MAG TPA: hypothetical protein VF316_06475 [Polyangiaceae bacterium]
MPATMKTDTAAASRRAAVVALVKAHSKLEDRHTGALWLSTKKSGVWLLEVVPTMPPDDRVGEPMEFLPSREFRYTLRLLSGREEDFLAALDRNVDLAEAVAAGTPIPAANAVTERLQKRAKKALKKPAR